jgi:hypothetical protein
LLAPFFLLGCFVGCGPAGDVSTQSPGQNSVERAEPPNPWPPEKIAENPQGFCVWAGQQLIEQLALLEGNRTELSGKLELLATRKKDFVANLEEIRNLANRARTALRRAEDEERWPVKFAGQSFSREKLESLIAVTSRYVEQRTPLAEDYSRAAQRLNIEIRKIDERVVEVKRQMEVVALDLERIKLSSELDGLPQLDSSSLNIAAVTSSLARPTEDDAIRLEIDELTTSTNPSMTLESFLKK